MRGNAKAHDAAERMDPDTIDRILRKYAAGIDLARGYSAHSMRATYSTTALENGAQLEDVQEAAGHRDPSTTKLYDRRGYDPETAASFFERIRNFPTRLRKQRNSREAKSRPGKLLWHP